MHQYDCFDPARPTCNDGTLVFHDECVGNHTGYSESRFFDTLENQISKNGDTGRNYDRQVHQEKLRSSETVLGDIPPDNAPSTDYRRNWQEQSCFQSGYGTKNRVRNKHPLA